jgi:ankyrin repeat protein
LLLGANAARKFNLVNEELQLSTGDTALHIAAKSGNLQVVTLLIQLGASVSTNQATGQTVNFFLNPLLRMSLSNFNPRFIRSFILHCSLKEGMAKGKHLLKLDTLTHTFYAHPHSHPLSSNFIIILFWQCNFR